MSFFRRLQEAALAVSSSAHTRPHRSLLQNLPRGGTDPALQELPAAQFQEPSPDLDPEFLYDPHRRPQALFVGIVQGRVANPDQPSQRYVVGGIPVGIADDRHQILVAGSRAGKGRSVIVPNMLDYRGSVMATDPKGELAMMTAVHRAEKLGHNVFVLDPFGVVKGPAARLRFGYNPIEAIRADKFAEDAALIADAIVAEVSEHDPHWDAGARAFIEGVVLHVKTVGRYAGRRTLGTVHELLLNGALDPETGQTSLKVGLFNEMRKNPHADGFVALAALEFFQRADREYSSMLSTVRRHLKFLSFPGIREVTGRHDLDLENLKVRPTTIYLCLPARHMGLCASWIRMFINLMLQRMEENIAPPVDNLPVLCILDEFATLGRMRQIEDAAGQIAGFGVKLMPVLQDLGQLKALYSDRWETFMGNAGVLQFFGNNDLTTLKWISERLGQTTVISESKGSMSAHSQASGESRGSWSETSQPLMTVDEVAQAFRRTDPDLRQLVIANDFPDPLILQKAYHDKHELFAGRAASADGFEDDEARLAAQAESKLKAAEDAAQRRERDEMEQAWARLKAEEADEAAIIPFRPTAQGQNDAPTL